MHNKIKLFLFLYVVVITPVSGYELITHAAMTQAAYQRSVISDEEFLDILGIDDKPVVPLGALYYEQTQSDINQVYAHEFESKRIRALGQNSLSIAGWFMRGAIREDDYLDHYFPCYLNAPNPQDDSIDRPINHFFDPANNTTIDIPFKIEKTAPNWSLGVVNAFAQIPAASKNRTNHYSLVDAREAMWRALTGMDRQGGMNIGPMGTSSNEAIKKAYWATTFRALGSVAHLIEDMAQPQHTRLDPHSGECIWVINELFAGHESEYEKYIDKRVEAKEFRFTTGEIGPGSLPNYGAYPIPEFEDYASYFSTLHIDGPDIMDRKGLADYSNRGFFTAGTNINGPDNQYNEPPNNTALLSVSDEPVKFPNTPGYTTRLYTHTVQDTNAPGLTSFGAAITTESLWFDFSEGVGAPIYTLSRAVYDDMADLLIPRGVAYSAGLLNHFFRGQLEIQVDQYSSTLISVKFRNLVANRQDDLVGLDSASLPGTLMLTYEYIDPADGMKKFGAADAPVDVNVTETIPFEGWSNFSYTFNLSGGNAIPTNATDIRLRLIFRGKLGQEEDSIAVGVTDVTSPGFIFTPNPTPTVDGIGGRRLLHKTDGQWVLDPQNGYEAGNIDWKGWYVNDRPTAALSWWGPPSRSIPAIFGTASFATTIYKDGELYSVAPLPVLGASLMKDSQGVDWIIAICKDGTNDKVYRRPNIQDTSPALYDPVTAPNGWQLIGDFSFPHDPQESSYVGLDADMPWFFNGDGTEAQTLRFVRDDNLFPGFSFYYRPRYKINITDASASFAFESLPKGNNISQIEIGVDYSDDDLLLLEFSQANWLSVNGDPLIDNTHIGALHFNEDPNGGPVFTGATSLSTGGYIAADDHQDMVNAVYATVHYLDIRSAVAGFAASLTPGGFGDLTNGSHTVTRSNAAKSASPWTNGNRYVPSSYYSLWSGGILGGYFLQTSFFHNGFTDPVTPSGGTDRSGNVFFSLKHNTTGRLNYLTGGSPVDLMYAPGTSAEFQQIGVK